MRKIRTILNYLLNPRPKYASEDIRPQANEAGPSKKQRRQHFLSPSLIFGLIIAVGLLLVVFLGPLWATENPYLNPFHEPFPRYDTTTGTLIQPPLAPSSEHPLGTNVYGNDNLSWLLFGARLTLATTVLATLGRLIIGVGLGSIAGWYTNRLPDLAISQLIPIITAIPMLISSTFLIYALGIEGGIVTFTVALTLVGWTEIAQLVRSELLVLRQQLYVEAARSVGLREVQIIVRHAWPNIFPRLVGAFFLEMGAVLLLLAELGFLGVFIGGGNLIATGATAIPVAFPDVPEWGLMLYQGTAYLRSKPFVIIGPAMAFFIAIVGFNLLGEGLRNFFDHTGVNTAFLTSKRFLFAVGVGAATIYIGVNYTGSDFWYRQAAQQFEAVAVRQYLDGLNTIPEEASSKVPPITDFLSQQFENLGLEPGWKPRVIEESYVYMTDTNQAHVMGLWTGYDYNLSREMVVVFTTYEQATAATKTDKRNLATMLALIRHLREQDVNPRRSFLFVAWQGSSTSAENYFGDPTNFRYLGPQRFGVKPFPALFLELGTAPEASGVWIHADSSEQVLTLLRTNAARVGADLLIDTTPDVAAPVSQLPWAYLAWSGSGTAETETVDLETFGEALALTLIALARDEAAWVWPEEETAAIIPTAIPTLPPGDNGTQGIRAVLLFDIQNPEPGTVFSPGWFMRYQATAVGAPGAYLEGKAYANLDLWITLKPVNEERIIARFRSSTGNKTQYMDFITLPNELESGSYRLIFTPRNNNFHGHPLEMVGETELVIIIEKAE
jgi:ABC-type dipeptide/oligopeptide/nickel transport system permease subunit